MAMTTCPNCGKPLRPGVRFCGNCGATIPAEHYELEASRPAQPSSLACPNCGKPVRVGAKFCNHCGKEIPQAGGKVPLPPKESPPSTSPVARISSAGKPGKKPPPIHVEGAKPAKRSIIPWLVSGLVVICLIGAAGGYITLRDPFHWLRTPTPLPSATMAAVLEPTGTAQVIIAPTNTHLSTPTLQIIPTEANTPTATIAATMDLTSTNPITLPLILTPTVSSVTAAPTLSILIEDDFSGALNEKWKAWGEPRPTIRTGFGDSWLDLKAADQPGQAGVTSRAEVSNAAGTEIEFEAQLNSGYPLYPLQLDWDPLQFDRGPENTMPTVVHLVVQKALVVLQAPAANNSCQTPLDGMQKHIYTVKFPSEKIVELYLDGAGQPVCELEIGIKAVSGRISFTGTGWVTRILISGADVP